MKHYLKQKDHVFERALRNMRRAGRRKRRGNDAIIL